MIEINEIVSFAKNYKVMFCDVWGVLHDGVKPFEGAVKALQKLRLNGVLVVLLTNSPRLCSQVAKQLQEIGVPKNTYDFIVTSGDATRDLIKKSPRKLFFIGSERELPIIDNLDIELVEEQEAQAVLCTGLFDNASDELSSYDELLRYFRSRNLPFICANPDYQVWRGNKLLYCAGALAKTYSTMGGRCMIAGKPHNAIYDLAYSYVQNTHIVVTKQDILAIGDGLLTDIKGAIDFGIDSLFILDGVNRSQFMVGGALDKNLLEAFIYSQGMRPKAYMLNLQ